MTTIQVGKQGEIILPLEMRTEAGIHGQSFVVIEKFGSGILVRPANPEPEIYTPERKAEFLLNNAVGVDDYAGAVEEVRKMGLDPSQILHRRPAGA